MFFSHQFVLHHALDDSYSIKASNHPLPPNNTEALTTNVNYMIQVKTQIACGFLTIISGYDSFNQCCLWSNVYVFCIFNVACSRTRKWRQNTSKVLWCAAMADMVGELLLGSVECIALFVNDNYYFCLISIDSWICNLC